VYTSAPSFVSAEYHTEYRGTLFLNDIFIENATRKEDPFPASIASHVQHFQDAVNTVFLRLFHPSSKEAGQELDDPADSCVNVRKV